MSFADAVLYRVAAALSNSELGVTRAQRRALQNADAYTEARAREASRVLAAAVQYGVPIRGRVVLDFGCADGPLSPVYLHAGAVKVIGVDIDAAAISRARALHRDEQRITFEVNSVSELPLSSRSVDVVVSYDVFEHIAQPRVALAELRRVLRPHGVALIGCWGWGHPFANHLGNMVPVPWAHLLVSERTFLRACRRVYEAPWYQPTMHDLDSTGRRIPDKYTNERISREWLNHWWLRDFEAAFRMVGFAVETHLEPFGRARWTRPLLRIRHLREILAGYAWFVLHNSVRLPGERL